MELVDREKWNRDNHIHRAGYTSYYKYTIKIEKFINDGKVPNSFQLSENSPNISNILDNIEHMLNISIHGSWEGAAERLIRVLFYNDEDKIKVLCELLNTKDDSNGIIVYELIMNRFNEFKTNKDYEKILQNMSNSINNA